MTPRKLFSCAVLLLGLSAAFDCGTSAQNGSTQGAAISSDQSGASGDSSYYLDLGKPSIEQAVDVRSTANETPKFVRVEVTRITNPRMHSLTFEVRYRAANNGTTYLGSFSPYPADNPGSFLVATQGKVKDAGVIILSLITPDKTDSTDVIRVAVKPLTLLKG